MDGSAPAQRRLRCAIYSPKFERGMGFAMEFNSLRCAREACEADIAASVRGPWFATPNAMTTAAFPAAPRAPA